MSGADKNWNKKVVLFKIETTEGTDATPASATDALQVLNLNPQFMDADFKVRNLELNYFGAKPSLPTSIKRGATFEMEMTGGATAGAAPGWMVPARIAGFAAPVIVASTSATISPITDAIPSGTLYQYVDDLLMQTIGARGSMGFTIEDDEIPVFNFNMLGRAPTALASQAVPTAPTLTGYPTPLIASTENTVITIDGFACGVRRWTMNSNGDLQYRSLINPVDRVIMADRPWNGELVIQVPDLTAKDYFAKIRPGTTMVANCVHGSVAGNIVTINCPKLQIGGNVSISNEQGKIMATMPVTALPNAGNDEITFAAT